MVYRSGYLRGGEVGGSGHPPYRKGVAVINAAASQSAYRKKCG